MTSGAVRTVVHVTESAFWPPYQGDSARNLAFIRGLRAAGWRVHVVHLHDRRQPSDYEAMAALCDTLAVYYPTEADLRFRHGPDPDAWCPAGLVALVSRTVVQTSPDALLVQFPFLSRCLTVRSAGPVRRVLDADNWFIGRAEQYRQGALEYDWYSTDEAGVRKAVARADVVLAIQQEEAARYRAVVPDGVEVLCVPHAICGTLRSAKFGAKRVLFIGNENAENTAGLRAFLQESWPQVLAAHPDAQMHVAGRVSTHAQGLHPSIQTHGTVQDLGLLYDSCPIALSLATVGTGLKIKSVEALAHGCLLVATTPGLQGLDAFDGVVARADGTAEQASAVIRALDAPAKAKELGNEAYQLVQRRFDSRVVIRELQRALQPEVLETSS